MPFTAAKLGADHASVIVGVGERARSRVLEAGVFGLRHCLARGNEAAFQGLWIDDHARYMAFDQLALRKGGWELRFTH